MGRIKANVYGIAPDGKKITSQREVVLNYLKAKPGRRITSLLAIQGWGFTRLSAIVKQIEKRDGIRLQREEIQVKTRFGGVVTVMAYWYEV